MISKILDLLFFVASWFLLGMGASLGIYYGNYDMWYYILAGILCFIISCIFCFTRKDQSEVEE